jgi:hypothetical protein
MSYYIYRDVVPFPAKKNNLSGDWAEASDWVLPDTCPKCHYLNCNQLLEGDKVSSYMCPNPECYHEWIPSTEMQIEEILIPIEQAQITD